MMRKRTVLPLLGAVICAASTALTSASGVVPASVDARPGVSAQSVVSQGGFHVDWHPCQEAKDVQCGTLRVPVNWSRPHGDQVSLAVARRPADDPDRRVGAVFYNPGGPGDGGVQYVLHADQVFTDAVRARFDIVTMDPRGIGDSTPSFWCELPALRRDDTTFPDSRKEFKQMRAYHARYGLSCLRGSGELLRNGDTRTVARDHDALRTALGEDQVSWLAISYGVQIAAQYADLYPEHTRALVLDANLDHSQSEINALTTEIQAVEGVFDRFISWCATDETCALKGQDVGAVYDQLVRRADRHPIPVRGALRPVTGDDIRMNTPAYLGFKYPTIFGEDKSWAGLSRMIKAAVAGNAEGFAMPSQADSHELDGRLGNACMDYQSDVETWSDMQQRMEMARQLAPHLQGGSELWEALRCSDWPIPPSNPPRRLDIRHVPALIVNATHDPSTSYTAALSMADQIRDSHLLTRVGDGHTSYYTSRCAQRAEERFLIGVKAPASQVCVD